MNERQVELEAILALRDARSKLAVGTRAFEEADARLRAAEQAFHSKDGDPPGFDRNERTLPM